MKNEVIGAMIKARREQMGLTQLRLAEKLNVSDKSVSKWETGKGLPDITTFPELARELGVSVSELMNGSRVTNKNHVFNMLHTRVCVCPDCGNVLWSTGDALICCCGNMLKPLEPMECDEKHMPRIERVEDQLYVSMEHDMTRTHHISFIAAVSDNGIQLTKLYPEGEAQAWFPIARTRILLVYCIKNGLFQKKVTK